MPTTAPTQSPTPAPTPHPCADGSHKCDKNAGGVCYERGGGSYECGCEGGFYEASPHAPPETAHVCTAVTPAPTPVPLQCAPTSTGGFRGTSGGGSARSTDSSYVCLPYHNFVRIDGAWAGGCVSAQFNR